MKRHKIICLVLIALVVLGLREKSQASEKVIPLTLDKAVEIAMANSYRVKQLQLGIERTRAYLRAERAGLKSKVYMNIKSPEVNAVSAYKWNSILRKDEIIRQNTRLWQMELSVRQPVILFGYPTDGYLSLNYKTYRYLQKDGYQDINYYNRYFVEFDQPIFQPNRLKNAIENAELKLKREELEYNADKINLVGDIAEDFYKLFRKSYKNEIYRHHLENVNHVAQIIQNAAQDTVHAFDAIQIKVEIANTREKLLQNQSELRLAIARMKRRLRINDSDSLDIVPDIKITPLYIDPEDAIQKGFTLNPDLRILAINRRRNQIDLENTKGRNAFHMNIEMTYGLEKEDENYRQLWNNEDNSYSVAVNAYIPLWDWGQRKARIQAQEISLRKTDLWIEERKRSIKTEITNAVENVKEYQSRVQSMKKNVEMAKHITDVSIKQFQQDQISLQDLLQNIDRQKETEFNFLDVYLGYRDALIKLIGYTFYDYEGNMPLLEHFNGQS